jgi:hypothetical protein
MTDKESIDKIIEEKIPAGSVNKIKSLKLEFSKAADAARITGMLQDSDTKAADPNHYVAGRVPGVFNKAVRDGCAVFFSDETGTLKTLTIAYHHSDDKNPGIKVKHEYTESGTTLSHVPGYNSSAPLVSALVLREWLNHPPAKKIVASIKPQNAASVKIYKDTLGWEEASEKDQARARDLAWRTVPDPADPSGKNGYQTLPPEAYGTVWFTANDKALVKQANILLEALDRGGLINKRTGDIIAVDFSALGKEGLTRERIKAIASGITSRKKIAAL